MQRTKIEWTDYVWNPIKGLCPVGCWYCYARRMYKRFKWNPRVRYELDDLKILNDLKGKEGSKIFVCSTFELFHPITNTLLFPLTEGSDMTYRDMVFSIIKDHPQHTFQILTKLPQNIDREMPNNVWLGVSIEKGNDNEAWKRIYYLKEIGSKTKFVSIEPMLGMLNTPIILNMVDFDWFIFGRLTGYGNKYNPDKRWIEPAVNYFKGYKKPIFLKDNLTEIWGESLIQEFPE